jgi:hypothetical protein
MVEERGEGEGGGRRGRRGRRGGRGRGEGETWKMEQESPRKRSLLKLSSAICGNGIRNAGEQCDGGAQCSSSCLCNNGYEPESTTSLGCRGNYSRAPVTPYPLSASAPPPPGAPCTAAPPPLPPSTAVSRVRCLPSSPFFLSSAPPDPSPSNLRKWPP